MKKMVSILLSMALCFQASANYGQGTVKSFSELKREVTVQSVPSQHQILFKSLNKNQINVNAKIEFGENQSARFTYSGKQYRLQRLNKDLFVVNGLELDLSKISNMKQFTKALQPMALHASEPTFLSMIESLFIPRAEAFPFAVVAIIMLSMFALHLEFDGNGNQNRSNPSAEGFVPVETGSAA